MSVTQWFPSGLCLRFCLWRHSTDPLLPLDFKMYTYVLKETANLFSNMPVTFDFSLHLVPQPPCTSAPVPLLSIIWEELSFSQASLPNGNNWPEVQACSLQGIQIRRDSSLVLSHFRTDLGSRDGSKETEVPLHLVIWVQSLAYPKRGIVRKSVKCPSVKEEQGGVTLNSG